MIQPTVGFVVYGVHKDGLLDPMGQPFIDESVIARSKQALRDRGLRLVEHDVIVATKITGPGSGLKHVRGGRLGFTAKGLPPPWPCRSRLTSSSNPATRAASAAMISSSSSRLAFCRSFTHRYFLRFA